MGHASLPGQAAPPRSVAERMAVAPRAPASPGSRQEITATSTEMGKPEFSDVGSLAWTGPGSMR